MALVFTIREAMQEYSPLQGLEKLASFVIAGNGRLRYWEDLGDNCRFSIDLMKVNFTAKPSRRIN